MTEKKLRTIYVFHCINAFGEGESLVADLDENITVKFQKLPCSSMVKDVYLLRAFEAGADAVMVAVCPKGTCRYVEGNARAIKRVQWVKGILDEIGLDGRRIMLFNLPHEDRTAFHLALSQIREQLTLLETAGLKLAV